MWNNKRNGLNILSNKPEFKLSLPSYLYWRGMSHNDVIKEELSEIHTILRLLSIHLVRNNFYFKPNASADIPNTSGSKPNASADIPNTTGVAAYPMLVPTYPTPVLTYLALMVAYSMLVTAYPRRVRVDPGHLENGSQTIVK